MRREVAKSLRDQRMQRAVLAAADESMPMPTDGQETNEQDVHEL